MFKGSFTLGLKSTWLVTETRKCSTICLWLSATIENCSYWTSSIRDSNKGPAIENKIFFGHKNLLDHQCSCVRRLDCSCLRTDKNVVSNNILTNVQVASVFLPTEHTTEPTNLIFYVAIHLNVSYNICWSFVSR